MGDTRGDGSPAAQEASAPLARSKPSCNLPSRYDVPCFVSRELGAGTAEGPGPGTATGDAETGTGTDCREYEARSSHLPKIIFPAVVCRTEVTETSMVLPIILRALSTTTMVPSSR